MWVGLPGGASLRNRILHVADLHLGDAHRYLGSRAGDRAREADSLFRRITDSALESERIGGLIIAGDLFDHYAPPAALVDSVLADLTRLREAGVRTLTVPGNHDEYSYPGCVYRQHESTWPDTLVTRPLPGKVASWMLDGVEVDLYAMAYVAGRSHPPFDAFDIEPGSARTIAVLHGSLDTNWSDRSIPLSRSNLEKLGLDYVALGHLHKPREIRAGAGWIAYPGRIEGGGFSDPGGAPLLEIEISSQGLEIHRVPFPSRRIETLRWNVSTIDSEAELQSKIEREQSRDASRILRIEFTGIAGFPIDVNTLEERWRDRFHHLEMRSEVSASADLDRLASEPTVRGEFARIARAAIAQMEDERERAIAEAALREGLAAFTAEEAAR